MDIADIDIHGVVCPVVLYTLDTLNLRHGVERMPYNPSMYFCLFVRSFVLTRVRVWVGGQTAGEHLKIHIKKSVQTDQYY